MKIHLILGVCVILCVSVTGRSVTNNGKNARLSHADPSRTLKGVLKFYREQPKTDSDSLENDSTKEVTNGEDKSYHLELPVTKAEEEHRPVRLNSKAKPLPIGIAIVDVKKTAAVEIVEKDQEGQEVTTVTPEQSGDEVSFVSKEQLINRSDLDTDDVELDLDGCSEGDVTRVSCNTCVCSAGNYFCSKRDCHDPEKPLPPIQKASSKRKTVIKYHKPSAESESESPVVKNETVSESVEGAGNYSATKIGHGGNSALLSQCIDGRTKPVDCNQCICALGQWACTKMSCIALTLREKASFSGGAFLKTAGTLKESMNMDEDCMEGEAKPKGCNQCVCHQNSWACSDLECPATTKPEKVEAVAETCQTEEDVKSKDCNICSCRRGLWVCTTNDCKQFGNRYFNPVSQKHSSNSDEADQEI